MESFLNRYRNITVLLLVIFAQLVLLAAQVKNDQDVRVIRVWAVSTVTPVARIAEFFRGGSAGFFRRYVLLHDASEENRKLRDEVGRLRLENNFLRNELNTADRAKALQVFQAHTPSKMLAANVIMTGVGANANVVFVNRGSNDGVMRGMGVVTPDGIVGKVVAAYPTGASQVMLVTDPEFSAGVVSQKSQSRGILKGQGSNPLCKVDYVPFEDKVEAGEWFYTAGDDRVFPRGFAVGQVKAVRPGTPFKEVLVAPAGIQHGVEDVLIILESVHQSIPDTPPGNQPVYIAPPPPASAAPVAQTPGDGAAAPAQPSGTEADKVRSIYQQSGEAQKHVFGTGLPGSKPPDFTKLGAQPAAPSATPAKPPAAAPQAAPSGTTPPKTAAPAAAPPKTAAPAGDTRLQRQAPDADGTPKPFTVRAPNASEGAAETPAQKNSAVPKKSAPPPKGPADNKGPAAPPKGPGGPGLE